METLETQKEKALGLVINNVLKDSQYDKHDFSQGKQPSYCVIWVWKGC